MENKIYYVYEWIRLDTNEPFYVGKGKEERWKKFYRGNNKKFKHIIQSISVAVHILQTNLTEEEAFEYECWYINEYLYIFGYDLANYTDGGEGTSGYKATEEDKKRNRMMINGFDMEDYKDKIIDMYVNQNMSSLDIAQYFNVSKTPILRILKKFNIILRTSGETLSVNQTGIKRYNAKCVLVKDVQDNIINCFGAMNECGQWIQKIGLVDNVVGGKKAVLLYLNKQENYKGLIFKSCTKEEYENYIKLKDSFTLYETKAYNINNVSYSMVVEVYDINNHLIQTFYSIKNCANWLLEIGFSNAYNSAEHGINRNTNNNHFFKNTYTFKKYTKSEYNSKIYNIAN